MINKTEQRVWFPIYNGIDLIKDKRLSYDLKLYNNYKTCKMIRLHYGNDTKEFNGKYITRNQSIE